MTYKAIIVDDEPMIRFGLISCIQWTEEGIELVGEANNGKAALELIKQHRIDILITDIKMPLMDGLELTSFAKEVRPLIKVILISSYSDFEYARRAVQLGVVVDYLLKPTMEPEDLQALLGICKARLDEELATEQKSDLHAREMQKWKLHEFGQRLKKIIEGENIALDWTPESWKPPFLLSIWQLETSPSLGAKDRLSRIETVAGELAVLCDYGTVSIMKESEIVLVMPSGYGKAEREITSYHSLLHSRGHTFTVGISPSFHHLHRLADAFGWADHALWQAFFDGKGHCYTGEIINSQTIASLPSLSEIPEWIVIRDRFSRALAGSDLHKSDETLQELFALWRTKRFSPSEIMTQANGILVMIFSHQYHLKTEEKVRILMNNLFQTQNAYTLDMVIDELNFQFQSLREYEPVHLVSEETGGQHAIQVALTYIQDNYRRNLSLQEVADHVHMSRNYFSELFKKRTGMNFIDFLIRLRIYYAKHLLETTNLKIYDIGMLSGFNSPKHFLKLFKREMNSTPAEYRHTSWGGGGEEVKHEDAEK